MRFFFFFFFFFHASKREFPFLELPVSIIFDHHYTAMASSDDTVQCYEVRSCAKDAKDRNGRTD